MRSLVLTTLVTTFAIQAHAAPFSIQIIAKGGVNPTVAHFGLMSFDGQTLALNGFSLQSQSVGPVLFDRTNGSYIPIQESLPDGTLRNVEQIMAMAPDGSALVGRTQSEEIFRWTPQTGLELLRDPDGNTVRGFPRAVSQGGSTIVGEMSAAQHGFHWTESNGWVAPFLLQDSNVPEISTPVNFFPYSITTDGQYFLGTTASRFETSGDILRVTADGIVDAYFGSGYGPRSVSGDGSTVDGYLIRRRSQPIITSIRTADQINTLETLPYVGPSVLNLFFSSMNEDGSVAVGFGYYDDSGTAANTTLFERPYIWTKTYGLQRLSDFLVLRGGPSVDGPESDWFPFIPVSISADGREILAFGQYYSPTNLIESGTYFAIVTIPETSTLTLLAAATIALAATAWFRSHQHT